MATHGELNEQLYGAVERNDIVETTALLERDTDINSRGALENRTLLIEASHKGYKAMVDLLLYREAAINETDNDGNTALIVAAKRGHKDIVDVLIQENADIEKKGLYGNTALIVAAWKGHEEIVDLLLQKNADTEKNGANCWTAIHRAAENNHPSIINRLVKCGATFDTFDQEGKTPLWWAAYHGHVNCVDVLLEVGANPQHKSKSEESPLDVAKRNGHNEVAKRMRAAMKSQRARFNTLPLQSTVAFDAPPPTRSQSTREASNSDLTSRQSDQSESVAPTGREAELMRQLMKQLLEHMEEKNRPIEQDQSKLHAAVREKSSMETETTQQLKTMQEERQSLLHALNEERREKTIIVQEKAELQREFDKQQRQKTTLQREFDEQQRENTTLQQQVEILRENSSQVNDHQVQELQERLAVSTAATEEIRQMLRQTEEVRSIPSCDIHLTDLTLGKGSYGAVRIADWQGCPVAVKMLYETLANSLHNIQLLLQEVSIGWKIHHPNIAGVCGVTLELQEGRKIAWIVMELLQGSMAGVIEAPQKGAHPLTLREQVDMAADSACGLNYLHSLSRLVLHGDIRPTNILVTAVMRAKLGDLGAARFSDATLSVGLVSPEYTAPERIDGRCPQKCKETDVYSMGVTMCELFTGLPPNTRVRMNQIQSIQHKDVFSLCVRMMAHDPSRRPSTAEVFFAIRRIRQSDDYKKCPPRRMVKGKVDGEDFVTLTDRMW